MTIVNWQPRDAAIKKLYDDGLSYEAIEQELEIPRGTVCGSISRMIAAGVLISRKPKSSAPQPSFGESLKRQAFRGVKVPTERSPSSGPSGSSDPLLAALGSVRRPAR